MRILILTVPDNYHAPLLLRELFGRLPSDEFLVFISSKSHGLLSKGIFRQHDWVYTYHKAKERLTYSLRVMIERALLTKLDERRYVRLTEVLNGFGIPHRRVASINRELDGIKAFRPDLVLSLYFDQIIGTKVLGICRDYSLNLHPSLLPSYAGSRPTFWVLANGETKTGISIHKLAKILDGGDLVYQADVEITPQDTQFSLYRRSTMGYLNPLLDCVETCRRGAPLPSIPVHPEIRPSCYSVVRKADMRAFLARGRKLI